MALQPPFMHSSGLITKIFERITEAQRPDRFTQDYLGSVLGYASGSAKPIIPLMKRLGFLNADGTPTQLYARFRNPSERASSMLEALKMGYPTLYARNEYVHALPREKLRDLVIEVTGLERDSSVTKGIVGTFEALKKVGEVGPNTAIGATQPLTPATPATAPTASISPISNGQDLGSKSNGQEVGMNLSYTINLNLPPSSDPEVFNAIFKALKEHLLGR